MTLDTGEKLYRGTRKNEAGGGSSRPASPPPPRMLPRTPPAPHAHPLRPPSGELEPTGWASAGKRQRVHVVYEEEGEIYVQLNQQGALASDSYACRSRR